jgi:hypothetical protein
MSKRLTKFVVFAGLVGPLVHIACGSAEERKFADPGTGGTSGGAGGSAGTTTGGSGGTTGGAAGGDAGPISCSGDPECDDSNSCNGVETCVNNQCQAGTNVSTGTTCTPNFGDAGVPEAGLGEYVCVEGQCLVKCATDDECEDNDVCTGQEICHPTTKTCLSGTPLACEDNDACTENQCDALTGCIYPLIDADQDGHASDTLGSCGDDCNDNDPLVYTGAAEICDTVDNNCNGDSTEAQPFWYSDCDADTFPPGNALSLQQCDKPTNVPTSCTGTGTWTSQAPGPGITDCVDTNAKAHPYTAATNSTAWQTTPIAGVGTGVDFDYNCDGTEEKEYTSGYVSSSASCTKSVLGLPYVIDANNGMKSVLGQAQVIDVVDVNNGGNGGAPGNTPHAAGGGGGIGGIGGITGFSCVGTDGWTGAPAACGVTASFSNCGASGTSCVRTTISKQQRCR